MPYSHLSDEQLAGVARFTLDILEPARETPADRAELEELADTFRDLAPAIIAEFRRKRDAANAAAFEHIAAMLAGPAGDN